MRRVAVRELKPYSLAEIATLAGIDESGALGVVERLMARGIVKYRASSLPNEDQSLDEMRAVSSELYQFRFVGLVMLGELVFVCYPKYIRRPDGPTEDEIRQTLAVIRKLGEGDHVAEMEEDGKPSDDKLATTVRLLELFGEYGLYSNFEETRELNGSGIIDWTRTINNHLPIVSHKCPIYIEYETRETRRDELDFVMRLHRAVLTECSLFLRECGIADLLSLNEVWLTDEKLDDMGGCDSLVWRLNRERNAQFVTWKQDVLYLMTVYLLNRDVDAKKDAVQSLGTASYYHAWELACKAVFADLLDTRLASTEINLVEGWRNRSHETLLGIIPHPKWERLGVEGGYIDCGNSPTLIPDIVAFRQRDDGGRVFCLYDAKYYVPSEYGKMEGQPGVESVIKQFFYQSAYRKFICDHGFDIVANAFLVPNEGREVKKLGRVSFPEVLPEEHEPLSNHIDMWALPAYELFAAYLKGERVSGRFTQIWEQERPE